jgi:hypothetical protein
MIVRSVDNPQHNPDSKWIGCSESNIACSGGRVGGPVLSSIVASGESGLRPERSSISLRISRLEEHRVMAAIVASENAGMKPIGSFAGYPVTELLRTALGHLADCDRKDAEFLRRLAAAQPNELPLAELKWLVGICRHVARKPLPRFHLYVNEARHTLDQSRLRFLNAP